jgi:hypothetical protein
MLCSCWNRWLELVLVLVRELLMSEFVWDVQVKVSERGYVVDS